MPCVRDNLPMARFASALISAALGLSSLGIGRHQDELGYVIGSVPWRKQKHTIIRVASVAMRFIPRSDLIFSSCSCIVPSRRTFHGGSSQKVHTGVQLAPLIEIWLLAGVSERG